MDISLIITLLALLLFSWSLYYYLFIKCRSDFFFLGKLGLLIIMLIIVPILTTTLYYQYGAKDRLKKSGFIPHPALESSVGISVGTGNNPIWIFSTELDKETLVDFYKKEQNHKGWKLIKEDEKWLIFTKDEENMRINISNNAILFMITPKKINNL